MAHHEVHTHTKLMLLASPLVSKHEHSSEVSSLPSTHYDPLNHDPEARPHQIDDDDLRMMPQFQRHEEATTIELFYDLFFVANLTTFTSLHEINESHALSSYAGFFCILWFTWCQVILFDVRFITDSVLERAAKACQFGVMVGLAVVGPNFDPSSQKQTTFRALSVILAMSRFVLMIQYLTVMWHVKNYKKSKTPITIIAASNFIAGIIYLAIAFTFKKKGNSSTYLAWYIVAVIETCVNIAVSSKWKVVSFKGTHLVQRMSLLTLIILGEGIIVICKNISKIVKNEFAWTSQTIGVVTASVAIIYILYMLYFDWLSHRHFGSIRQQIWAFLHFPFHLSLVLFMEGAAQFLIWQKIIEVVHNIFSAFNSTITSWATIVDPKIPDLVESLNIIGQSFMAVYPPEYLDTNEEYQATLGSFADVKLGTNSTVDEFADLIKRLGDILQNSIFLTYGIVAPKDKKAIGPADVSDELAKQDNIHALVFVYFFVTAGTALLLMNFLNYLSISHKSNGPLSKTVKIRLALTTGVGIALCLLATVWISLTETFSDSPWILPTVTIALLVVLVSTQVGRVGDKVQHKE